MATQTTSPSIVPLVVVTILTSMCVALPGETRAAEQTAQSIINPIYVGESHRSHNELRSADVVAEERWARSQDDYVLGEGGQVIRQEKAPELIEPAVTNAYRFDETHNQFDSALQKATLECGPSPATPAEITRLVIDAAQRHKVDAGFAVAVVTAESHLDRLRNSPKGARGPMQLMPETAERFGVADICDPEENIDGGVRYLRELIGEFRNPLLVPAAYNAGEGRVREHGGIPPFKETVGYVAEVLNIQMGLEGSGPDVREQHSAVEDPQLPSNISGVITSRERRQWVGGVMHF